MTADHGVAMFQRQSGALMPAHRVRQVEDAGGRGVHVAEDERQAQQQRGSEPAAGRRDLAQLPADSRLASVWSCDRNIYSPIRARLVSLGQHH